jgi:hypothetical protein
MCYCNCLDVTTPTIVKPSRQITEIFSSLSLSLSLSPKCYAGGSVATGRVSLAGQDEDERSDKERYPGPPGWGLRRWTSTPTLAKMFLN